MEDQNLELKKVHPTIRSIIGRHISCLWTHAFFHWTCITKTKQAPLL